jgi:signal transduction histidine kinase
MIKIALNHAYIIRVIVLLLLPFWASGISQINTYHEQLKAEVQKLCNEKKYQKSLEYCIGEIELAQQQKDLIKECVATKLLGTTFYHMGRPKEAKREWVKAIRLSEQANVLMVAQNCYSNLGALALESGEYKVAEKYFITSLGYAEKRGPEAEADYLNTLRLLASFYGESKQFAKADSLFMQLLNNPNIPKNTSSYYTAQIFYSRILVESGRWQQGIALSDSCLRIARKLDNYDLYTTALSLHITNLAHQKRFEEVYQFNTELGQLVSQRNSRIIDKNISDAEVKFNTSQISYEKEMSELKSKKDAEQLIYLSIGIIGLITASFIFITQRRKIRANELVQQEKIRALLAGEEKERTRVAKDLHDGIVQNLTALKMNLQSLQTPSLAQQDELQKIGAEIDLLNQEIRAIAYQMMPVTLKELGLAKALEDAFARNLKSLHIAYHFESIGFETRLPEHIEVNLFRIGQELLNNLIKHSKASKVDILLMNRNERIQLIVEDNGIGIPAGKIQEGIGMNSIRIRLSAMQGKITFEPREQGGTVVSILVPLNA